MRLTSIKIAGFKSFAELVNIPTAATLTGIVGPNGCGKSNVVDAIRWVMGERSASAMRGEDMQDVIFNGSSDRPSMDRASVELHFSPVVLPASSPWSRFSELSIKRLMYRNKTSEYFINNGKVRRRDIADLFLGTGLGPRSYAIIEQGMVNRIVESNPKDLRIYFEEAAGVSKYKERRAETESRMEDTRTNLLRVEDIRSTVVTQVEKLREQAKTAQEYKFLQDEFLSKQRLTAIIELQNLSNENNEHIQALQKEVELTNSLQTQKTKYEKNLNLQEEAWQNAQNELEEKQSDISALQAQIAELEQNLRLGAQNRQHLQNNREKLIERINNLEDQKQVLVEEQEMLLATRETLVENKNILEEEFLTTQNTFYNSEKTLTEQKRKVEEIRRQETLSAGIRAAKNQEKTSIANRLQEIIAEVEELQNQLTFLPDSKIENENLQIQAFPQAEELVELKLAIENLQEELLNNENYLSEVLENKNQISEKINLLKRSESELNGKIRTLERQLNAIEENNGEGLTQWLASEKLLPSKSLAENIRADSHWEHAIYIVLEECLGSKYVTNIDNHSFLQNSIPPAGGLIIDSPTIINITCKKGSLAEYFQIDDPAFSSWLTQKLNDYLCTNDWQSAIKNRNNLAPHEFFVTPEGIQISREQIIFPGSGGARAVHLENLHAYDEALKFLHINGSELQNLLGNLEESNKKQEKTKAHINNLSEKIKSHSNQVYELEKAQKDWLYSVKSEREKSDWEKTNLESQLAELINQQNSYQSKLHLISEDLQINLNSDNNLHEQINFEVTKQNELEVALRNIREKQHQKEINLRTYEQQLIQNTRDTERNAEQLNKLQQATEQSTDQLEEIETQLSEIPDGVDVDNELQNLINERVGLESVKKELLGKVHEYGESLKNSRAQIQKFDWQMQKSRDKLEALRLKNQESEMRSEQYREHYVRHGGDLSELTNITPPENVNSNSLKQLREQILIAEEKMKSLEPVNLAAINELAQESDKLENLQKQQADLTEALNTLTSAISRIDIETRGRMQEVFSAVNIKFSQYFRQIFGGGNAEVILSGDEILDAGVLIKAQPLGKKNSSIHLLSGGEKALTAIALIFAFFSLNPAPFCVLDEIDAPLDDNNTRLFTELIKEMKSQTQFLIITHNRITMEAMDILAGVTMSEPGVSKMVAVDLLNSLKVS